MIRVILKLVAGLVLSFFIALCWVFAWLLGQSDYGPLALYIVLVLLFNRDFHQGQQPPSQGGNKQWANAA